MTAIESINTGFYPVGVSEKLDNINKQLKDLPKVLDKETLENFQKGEYDITLKEYTDMNTYRTTMTALYGNSSANKFNSAINNYLGIKSDKTATAKEFIEKLEDKGVSKDSALKLYTALKSYTSMATMLGKTNSFVSAKI